MTMIRCMCYTFEKVSKTVCALYFKAYNIIYCYYRIFYALTRDQLPILHDRYDVDGMTFGNQTLRFYGFILLFWRQMMTYLPRKHSV